MTHPHDPTDRRPSEGAAEQYVLVAAGAVIVALTIASFWLSYAHLAEVAGQHGLGGSLTRQWAWPGTVDAFIITGELLMLRAGLRRETDGWAIGLTITGSVGSIALNVAGVHGSTDAAVPLLDYIVAAVPPTAALLAFGVLMRQIHQLVAPRSQQGESPATTAAPGTGTVADGRQDTPKQSTPDAEVTETGTTSPHEGDGPNADSLVPFAGLEKATADGDGPHTISATVPFPKHQEEAAGPHAQEQGTGHRTVPAGNGPLPGAGAATTSSQDNPPASRQRAIPKSLARGDRPEHEHAVPGTGLEQPLPHPVPEDRPDIDGDPGLNGDRPDNDGDPDPNGDRPDNDGDPDPNGDRPDNDGDPDPNGDRPDNDGDPERPPASKGRRPRVPRLTEDEIVELVRPHIPGVLVRDGNEDVTRVQLRGIMREHKIPIRNDRLTPVLARLRTTQATNARSTR